MAVSRHLTNTFLHRVYLLGYAGWHCPRSIRRMVARTEIHRAWFLGSTGHFSQHGIRFGLAHPYRYGTDTEVRS